MGLTQPEPALLDAPTPRLSFENSSENLTTSHVRPPSEFDPYTNAKIGSPFHLYHTNSPRNSENKSRPDINIRVADLEAGLTPQSTHHASPALLEKRRSNESGKLKQGSGGWWGRKQGRCMTKPKVSRWKSLPKKQRLIIKVVVSVIVAGLIVGLAVGLTKALGGGVWRSNNSSSTIE